MATGLSLLRGSTAGVVAAVLIFGWTLLVGLVDSESWMVFLVAMVAGVVFALIPSGQPRLEATGAVLVGLGAVVFGIATGWGWLEYSGVVGPTLALLWLVTGERLPQERWHWLLASGVVAFVVACVVVPSIIEGGTLDFDESSYGVKARSWLEGSPETGWEPHRGIAMSLYGYLVLKMGGAEAGLRLLGLVGLLTLVVAVWSLGRHLAGPRVGALAAVGILAGPSMLRRSTEYLSDVPAAGLLVWCMVVVWRELGRREAPTYGLLWTLPLAWSAFYLRYQSILSFVLIALVVVIIWWRKIRQRPGPVLVMAVVGLLGFIPHAVHAVELTGQPWGILTYTGRAVAPASFAEGLVDYASDFFWALGGYIGPVAVLAAVAGTIGYRRDLITKERFLFVMVPAVLQVLVLGVLAHGEPRFVFFPLAMMMIAGAMTLDRWVRERQGRRRMAVVAVLAALLVGSLAISASAARTIVASRSRANLPIEMAAEEARAQSGEATCAVLTTFTPQVTYYSGCSTAVFRRALAPELVVEALQGERRFMVLIENGRRQPEGPELAAYLDLTTGAPVLIEGALDVGVYSFAE